MYGIGAVKYKDFTIGYIEKNSFDLGGKKPEAAKIEAEQVQGAPVLVIPQSNGGIAPTFNVIQMNYSNLHKLLGGSLHYKKEDSEKKTPIGWTAPSEVLVMQGPWELSLVSGQSVLIPNATLLSNPAGKLTLTETSKIEVTLEVAMPEDGSQPYGVFDTEAIPDEWGQYKLPPAEAAAAASLQSDLAVERPVVRACAAVEYRDIHPPRPFLRVGEHGPVTPVHVGALDVLKKDQGQARRKIQPSFRHLSRFRVDALSLPGPALRPQDRD